MRGIQIDMITDNKENEAIKEKSILPKDYKRKIVIGAILFIAAALIIFVFIRNVVKRNRIENELPQIKIGSDNYPPFNYMDADGNPTGIYVDFAKEAFLRMGYEAVFVQINWEDKKELVESGEIDCIWGSFSMDGREDEYRWAGPYMVSRQVVAVNEDSDIYTLSDLAGKTVAVQTTTKPEEIFLERTDARIPQLREVFSLQNRELIYTFLSKGYSDAAAAHETAIRQYMADYGVEYRILDEALLTVGLGVAFGINDERGLDTELTQVFEDMRNDGTAQQIIGRYLENAEKYLEVGSYEK